LPPQLPWSDQLCRRQVLECLEILLVMEWVTSSFPEKRSMEAIGNRDKDGVVAASAAGGEIGEMEEDGEVEEEVEIIEETMVIGKEIENQREIEIGETAEMTEILEIIETNEAEIGMMETTDVGEGEIMIEEITEIIETIETMIEETTEIIEMIETEKDLVKRIGKEVDPIMIIMKGGIGRKGQMMPAKTKVHRT